MVSPSERTLFQELRTTLRDQDAAGLAAFEKSMATRTLSAAMRSALSAQLACARNEPAKARAQLAAAAKMRALIPEERLTLGHLLLDEGKVAEADHELAAAESAGLQDPRTATGRALAALARGALEEALGHGRRAVALDEAFWHAHYVVGLALAGQAASGQDPATARPYLEPARAAFRRVTELLPALELGWLGLAAHSAPLGGEAAAEAARLLAGVLAERPSAPLAMALADCLRASGDRFAAVAVLTPYVQNSMDPDLVGDYVTLALSAERADIASASLDAARRRGVSSARLDHLAQVIAAMPQSTPPAP